MPRIDLKSMFNRQRVWIDFVALSLIGFITAGLFYGLLVYVLKDAEHNARWINIAGKQRMLSQAISVDIFRLYHFNDSYLDLNPERKALIAARLDHNVAQANEHIKQLTQDAPLTQAIDALYFQEGHLIAELESFLQSAAVFSLNPTNTELFFAINQQSDPLLVKLDQAVSLYQLISEQSIERVIQLKTYIWIAILTMLCLQLMFIFLPLIQKLHRLHHQTKNLEAQAMHDPLTGLLNRLNMEEDVLNCITEHTESRVPFAVLALDIDHFKRVNDEYGHQQGDMVLKQLSSRIKEHVRGSDSAYRSGGEEFVVLLQNISLDSAHEKAEEIRQAVEHVPFQLESTAISKTISIGIFHSSIKDCATAADSLNFADEALYCSKRTGRNRVTIYDPNQSCLSS